MSGNELSELATLPFQQHKNILLEKSDKARTRLASFGARMLTWVKVTARSSPEKVTCLRMKEPLSMDAFEVQAFVRRGGTTFVTPFPSASIIRTETNSDNQWKLPTYAQMRWECRPAGMSKDTAPLMEIRAFVTNLRAPGLPTKEIWTT